MLVYQLVEAPTKAKNRWPPTPAIRTLDPVRPGPLESMPIVYLFSSEP